MPVFSLFIVFLIFAVILGIIFLVYTNKLRNRIQYKFRLRSNCLLTQHPIIFLSGKTSIFYSGRYWNCIPDWLEAHGYDVLEFEFSQNSFLHRTKELQNLLDLLKGESFHFAADISSIKELEWLAKNKASYTKSLTLFGSQTPPKTHPAINYFPAPSQKTKHNKLLPWKIVSKLHLIINKFPLCGPTLCLPGFHNDNSNVHKYLNWAISLAEKDLS